MILVVILIVMGPERLPKFARQLGAAWHEIVRIRQEVTDEVRAVMPDLDLTSIPRIPSVRGTLTGFITDANSPKVATDGEAASGNGSGAGDGADIASAEASTAAPSAETHPELADFAPAADDPSMN
jgi:hypothetical protein